MPEMYKKSQLILRKYFTDKRIVQILRAPLSLSQLNKGCILRKSVVTLYKKQVQPIMYIYDQDKLKELSKFCVHINIYKILAKTLRTDNNK